MYAMENSQFRSKIFSENIGEEKDYSACGGIAFFNSHFRFLMRIRWQKLAVKMQRNVPRKKKIVVQRAELEILWIFRYVRMYGRPI